MRMEEKGEGKNTRLVGGSEAAQWERVKKFTFRVTAARFLSSRAHGLFVYLVAAAGEA